MTWPRWLLPHSLNHKTETLTGDKKTVPKIRFTDFKTYTRAKSLDRFTDSEPEIRRAAFECLGRFELKKRVRLIGCRISHLEKEEKTLWNRY